MKKTAILILMMLLSVICYAQYEDGFTEVNEFGEKISEPEEDDTDYFGFRLLSGSNNDLVRFYEIHVTFDRKLKFTQLTMDDFVYKVMGRTKSKANPYGKNLFETYGIKDPNIVCSLWKLRYSDYPYGRPGRPDKKEPGWANNENSEVLPSEEQFAVLGKYGIHKVQDLCYGDMCFLLLKDMCDPGWVSKYCNRGAGGANPISEDGSYQDEEEYLENQ